MEAFVLVSIAVCSGALKLFADKATARRAELQDRKVSCALDIVLIWAQTWGQDKQIVHSHLSRTLDRYGMRYELSELDAREPAREVVRVGVSRRSTDAVPGEVADGSRSPAL